MLAIDRQHLTAQSQQHKNKNISMVWKMSTDRKQKREQYKRDKAGDNAGEVSKPKTLFKKDINYKTKKTTQERCVEVDVVKKTGLMVDAADLMVERKEKSADNTKSLLDPKPAETAGNQHILALIL